MNLAQAYRLGAFASPATPSAHDVILAGGSGGNAIARSLDGGNTWAGCGSSIMTTCKSIAFNNTMYIAVGSGANTIAYSYDGLNWIGLGTSIFSTSGTAICWTGIRWIAGGYGINGLAYSNNGIDWTGLGSSVFGDNVCHAIALNDDMIFAAGSADGDLKCGAYSVDGGMEWTTVSMGLTNVQDIKWNGSIWVAAGYKTSGESIAYSTNGTSWTLTNNNSSAGYLFDNGGWGVAWNGTLWAMVGYDMYDENNACDVAYSTNGISWSYNSWSVFHTFASTICWTGTVWLVGGNATVSKPNTLAKSVDLSSWTGLGVSVFSNSCNCIIIKKAA